MVHPVRGLGCVIGPPFFGIDLDDVRDPGSGVIEAEAQAFIKEVNSLTEISPSGTGGAWSPCRGRLSVPTKGDLMKALTTQIAERKAWLLENNKCVNADFKALTFYRESGELDEEKTLSAINKLASRKGFQESVEMRESGRRNGSGRVITESDTVDLAKKVNGLSRSYGISKAEALLMLSRPAERPHALVTESEIRQGWARYSDILTESEIGALVKNRVAAPTK
jgi:hypothetical protein